MISTHEQGPAGPGPMLSGLPSRPRRRFLARALGLGAGAAGLALSGRSASAQAAVVNDPAILNFTLHFEYLGSEYYTYALTGAGIEAQNIRTDGMGMAGPVVVKPNPQVPFATDAIRQYALDLAVEEQRHVIYIRNTLVGFGVQPVARPTLDLLNSFNMMAAAAGLPTPFDPFANEVNFLLGAYILEDTCVSALRGAAPLLKNKDVINGSAGLLGVEAYQAAMIRTNLFQLGQGRATDLISNLRRTLGGSVDYGVDDGPLAGGPAGQASIVLADSNALVPGRTTRQILNIAYGAINASAGGFFPNGLNGTIR